MSYTTVKDLMDVLAKLPPDQLIFCEYYNLHEERCLDNVEVSEYTLGEYYTGPGEESNSLKALREKLPKDTKFSVVRSEY